METNQCKHNSCWVYNPTDKSYTCPLCLNVIDKDGELVGSSYLGKDDLLNMLNLFENG